MIVITLSSYPMGVTDSDYDTTPPHGMLGRYAPPWNCRCIMCKPAGERRAADGKPEPPDPPDHRELKKR